MRSSDGTRNQAQIVDGGEVMLWDGVSLEHLAPMRKIQGHRYVMMMIMIMIMMMMMMVNNDNDV